MFTVILLIITTCTSLYASQALEDPLMEEDRQCIKKLSLKYHEFREEITLMNLRSHPVLWKLLLKHKICESIGDASQSLLWIKSQIENLETQISSIDKEMEEYEKIVWLSADGTNIEAQIKAINSAAKAIKHGARSEENHEKLSILKTWREAAQRKQALQNLVNCLSSFYEEESEELRPSAHAMAEFIVKSEELTEHLKMALKRTPIVTRRIIQQLCESHRAI